MGDHHGADAAGLAQAAAARGSWGEAFDLLTAADADGSLNPADLPQLGEVAYAAGHLDVTIATWERVHAACLEAGDDIGAAGAAARVAMHLLFDTALLAPVRGWLARAERLLEGHDVGPAHAWHAVVRTYERLLGGDFDGARAWARRAIEAGDGTEPAACAIARVAEARLLILDGEVEEGVALLDEVGVAAVSGDLDPLSTGVVYCELVCALQGLAQYDLAEQWTEAMERWCQTNAIGSLHGRCRVHRAEILRLRGRWDEAEAEALAACDELRPYLRRELGWPLSELGRIRLRKGDLRGAEQASRAAHHAGWDAQPVLAMVRLSEGNVETAATSIREALERPNPVPSKERPPNSGLQRAPLLEAQAEIELAAGGVDRARSAAEELEAIAERFRSKALVATAALTSGRVRLAEGHAADATQSFTDAVKLWQEVGAPFETATARLALADAHRATGREQAAELEREAAQVLLAGLGGSEEGVVGSTTRAGRSPQPVASRHVFRQEGDYWSVSFDGQTVRVHDLKGMRYLRRLLCEPGRELHVLDLAAAERAEEPPTRRRTESDASSSGLGDAGPVLDHQAKEAYRRRLSEIDDDIAEARSAGDDERAAQAEIERDFLVRELSRAFGLGGRDRRAGSASERARVAVTRALRLAMSRISEHHAPLGDHLDRAVSTGTYCSYLPDPRAPVEWEC